MSEVHYDDCAIKKAHEMFGGAPAFMGCACHLRTIAALKAEVERLREQRDESYVLGGRLVDRIQSLEAQLLQSRLATSAEAVKVVEILTVEYRVQNILGDWICDLCGGEIKWPDHKPECTIGQVLAILVRAQAQKDQGERA
jgi:hypothetical protein